MKNLFAKWFGSFIQWAFWTLYAHTPENQEKIQQASESMLVADAEIKVKVLSVKKGKLRYDVCVVRRPKMQDIVVRFSRHQIPEIKEIILDDRTIRRVTVEAKTPTECITSVIANNPGYSIKEKGAPRKTKEKTYKTSFVLQKDKENKKTAAPGVADKIKRNLDVAIK